MIHSGRGPNGPPPIEFFDPRDHSRMPRRVLPVVLLILLFAGTAAPFGAAAQDEPSTEERVKSPDAVVYVDGLACPFCAYGLEKKLGTLDAIDAMEVQVEQSRILVAFREGRRATEEDLRRAVEEAGFSARTIEFPEDNPEHSR